jgi:hypothetical protein
MDMAIPLGPRLRHGFQELTDERHGDQEHQEIKEDDLVLHAQIS